MPKFAFILTDSLNKLKRFRAVALPKSHTCSAEKRRADMR